jgi:hypothetical protein
MRIEMIKMAKTHITTPFLGGVILRKPDAFLRGAVRTCEVRVSSASQLSNPPCEWVWPELHHVACLLIPVSDSTLWWTDIYSHIHHTDCESSISCGYLYFCSTIPHTCCRPSSFMVTKSTFSAARRRVIHIFQHQLEIIILIRANIWYTYQSSP